MNRFFQALISRFLHDHLDGFEIQDEYRLMELFYYDPYRNPLRRRAPIQKPDFVIRHRRHIVAILDAKYRDLWEKALPRDMLYQLSLYALGSTLHRRKAVILYPSLTSIAHDQAILIREPVSGLPEAEVILRPVNLLLIEELLRAKDATARRRRTALAHQLSFGIKREFYGESFIGGRNRVHHRNLAGSRTGENLV
jgi:5-methylcytosine-specific restriction enzyme subunit McrC